MTILKPKKQMLKLVEVLLPTNNRDGTSAYLRETFINSDHIISITQDVNAAALHAEGRMPSGLHDAQQFSKLSLSNGQEMVVVGTPSLIQSKAKKVLHG